MDPFSHSRVEQWNKCRFSWYLKYIAEIRVIPNQDADNALILGQALHLGIEKGVKAAIDWYFSQYYVITDLHINEAIKFETLIPKARAILPPGQFEVPIQTGEFVGFIDLLVYGDIYDFKYTKSIERYLDSPQLCLYRYYGRLSGRLFFVHVPKTQIRMKKTEDLYQFRKRLKNELSSMQVTITEVPYSRDKVEQVALAAIEMYKTKLAWREENERQQVHPTYDPASLILQFFPKTITNLCDWCDYQNYCLGGQTFMLLPKNERREVLINSTPDMWLYGDSYTGKTVFMDSFDNVLFLNTDGNVDHISSPVVRIKDEITQDGRITRRRLAWDMFLEAVSELEKRDNSFQTIVIDLVEDVFEHCRLYMYDKLSIEHEQDAGFGKGWDMVRTEFLSTMKRLKNCGYQLVFISKVVSKEITRKTGEKVTTFTPNVNDKVSNVLAGIVDLTARVVADGDDRYLSFKTSPYIFGGSRYNFGVDQISLNRDEFWKILHAAQAGKAVRAKREPVEKPSTPQASESSIPEDTASSEVPEQAETEQPRRARRSRK